jgi:two-component system, OmpR family, sensor histidine kinase MtrB
VTAPQAPHAGRDGAPRRLADMARELVLLARRAVAAGARRLRHLWRSSLQFRVIVSTMLLGLVVVLALGSYLYQQIANGLVDARVSQAKQDALQGSRSAQTQFDATDNTDTTSMTQLATDIASQLASPGADQSRDIILVRSGDSSSPTKIPTILSGDIGLPSIPGELRKAVAADPTHQKTQVISVTSEQTGQAVPAVIVGSQVTVPTAGRYELYFVFPMDREEATLDVVSRTFTVGGIALVLLVGAVAYVVTRVVVDPVRRAALVAERLSSGRLNERMTARGEDDIARLAAAFNGMADNLQRQIRQLENLSRVQQRFSSDVSHELRTPLTTIRMAGELLYDSRGDFAPPVARTAELLHAEIDRFEALLTDLLEISRFDAGAAALDLEATDLRSVATRVVESTTTLATRRGSELVVQDPGVPCIAEVDPRRVERILRNLVVNAVEHGDGHPVTVSFGVNETAVAVAVRDHGVGLRPGEAGLVFNRFWRADPARARSTGGTGLGLAISLEDARLHEGWLQAWGEPGRGSCFRLTVPRRTGVPIDRSPLPLVPDEQSTGGGARRAPLAITPGSQGEES